MILNLFDQQLQLINTKLVIKNRLNELLSELKIFKSPDNVSRRIDHKVFHSTSKLIVSDSDNDEAFTFMH